MLEGVCSKGALLLQCRWRGAMGRLHIRGSGGTLSSSVRGLMLAYAQKQRDVVPLIDDELLLCHNLGSTVTCGVTRWRISPG